MKKYDKVYIPAEGRSQTDYYMDREGDLVGLTELSGRIVLTIEEAKELWDAAEAFYSMPMGNPRFDQYLTDKGIHVP